MYGLFNRRLQNLRKKRLLLVHVFKYDTKHKNENLRVSDWTNECN